MASTSNSSAVVTKGKWHVGPRNAGVDLVGTKTGAGRLLVLFGHDETLQRRSATATLGCRRFVAVRIEPEPVLAQTDFWRRRASRCQRRNGRSPTKPPRDGGEAGMPHLGTMHGAQLPGGEGEECWGCWCVGGCVVCLCHGGRVIDVIWGWLRRFSWYHPCWLLWCVCVTGTTQAGLLWHLWHLWHLGALHRASHLLCGWHSVMEPRAAWGRLGVGMTKVGFDPRRSQVLVSSQLSTLAWCSPSPHHVDSMPGVTE